MGTIFSGTGLISGLDIQGIVDKLIAIEAKPRDQLQSRVSTISTQRTAFLEISARISALLGRISALSQASSFRVTKSISSNADILGATTGDNAPAGSYQFIVRALAATHQVVSSGVSDAGAPLTGGTLTIESARAKVNRSSKLDELNGYTGVQRGSFEITDGDGSKATVNITDAVTLDEVVDRINAAGIDVTAEIQDDGLVLKERNGGTIRVRDIDGGRTAADLGFAAGSNTATGTLRGTTLARLSLDSPLSGLNDGRGVRRASGGGDFKVTNSQGRTFNVDLSGILTDSTRVERLNRGRGVQLGQIKITNRQGHATTVDVSGAQTIGDVKRILDQSGAGVSVVLNAGRLLISDTTAATSGTLKIEEVGNGTTARDLGIQTSTDTNKITGNTILSVDTLGDVVRAINYADGNDGSVAAALDPNSASGLTLADSGDGTTGRVILESLNGSRALQDVGFAAGDYSSDDPIHGQRIVGGVNTTLLSSLNGGSGFQLGVIHVTSVSGSADVDLHGAQTLTDVLDKINAANVGVEARIDPTGTRILLANSDGSAGAIQVSDVSGNFASLSGLDQAAQNGTIRGKNLQRQYFNENTKLTELNAGRGVSQGSFRITNSQSRTAIINIGSSVTTLGGVIEAVNDANAGVTARINDNGDGVVLEDTAGGTGTLKVEEQGGATARDLNIVGSGTNGKIDGSFELNIAVQPSDTLNSIVTRINNASPLARATVLNDGSGVNPYRLSLAAAQSGAAGELVVDGDALGLNFSTLSRAADARVLVGGDAGGGILVTSSTNTVNNVVNGLTLNLTGTSTQAVTVTVDRNYDSILAALSGFASDFNSTIGRIKQLSDYDQSSDKSGPLLGDGTAQSVESRLNRLITTSISGTGSNLTRLSQIGIRFDNGGDITFDADKFTNALNQNPEDVIRFFTDATNGVAAKLKSAIGEITDDGGLIQRRGKTLDQQKQQLTDRIDTLNELLDRKRTRLMAQFQAMESALSGLQSQQNALSSIAALK